MLFYSWMRNIINLHIISLFIKYEWIPNCIVIIYNILISIAHISFCEGLNDAVMYPKLVNLPGYQMTKNAVNTAKSLMKEIETVSQRWYC